MRLIKDDLPMEGEESDSASVTFEFEGYVYYIGQLDGPPGWFSRQTIEDYQNNLENWEKPNGWIPENSKQFKFLKKD